jgi:chromosome segregation ATPase
VRFAQEGVSVRLAEAAANSPEALEAIEADAEAADEQAGTPATFLQRLMSKPAAKAKTSFLATRASASPAANEADEAVVTLLRDKGQHLKSTVLISLANRISADPLAKVKQLIQELIERLLTEAANEANQKGWCDKASADAKQKRERAATEIADSNGKMAELEAAISKLTEELAILKDEIAELKEKVKVAEKLRKEEKEENAATLVEANAGLKAVKMAIDVLDKFYKTVDDAKVDLSLVQQDPADDVPDAGFDIGEAYTGAQGAATGIIGMLDVIKSDFERTLSETEKEEAKAAKEHLEFMTKTGVSLAEKTMAQEQKKNYKDDAAEQLEDATESLKDNTEILTKAIAELLDLKPVCVDTGMSYEDRVARRQDEIDALNKASCILNAYAEYGPDGAKEC